MQINDKDQAKNEDLDFLRNSDEFYKIVHQGLVREELRGEFMKEYLGRYSDVILVACKEMTKVIKDKEVSSAEIFEVISLFPNFSTLEEESEGLFFDVDTKDIKKAFE